MKPGLNQGDYKKKVSALATQWEGVTEILVAGAHRTLCGRPSSTHPEYNSSPPELMEPRANSSRLSPPPY